MKDFIPKGTGNSRFLRSISNFKTLYPTYDDFVNAMVAGTLPVDFNGINEAGVQQVGTALNKANLLTDEVAQKMGLAMADPRPIDMFGVLADAGNIHVWAFVDSSGNKDFHVSVNRNAYQEGTSGGTTIAYLGKLGDKARIEVGSYVGTGVSHTAESSPFVLSFNYAPKIVFVYAQEHGGEIAMTPPSGYFPQFVIIASEYTTSYTDGRGLYTVVSSSYKPINNVRGKKSSDGKIFSMYYPSGKGEVNAKNTKYYYWALL